jgi:hypothetical protein
MAEAERFPAYLRRSPELKLALAVQPAPVLASSMPVSGRSVPGIS